MFQKAIKLKRSGTFWPRWFVGNWDKTSRYDPLRTSYAEMKWNTTGDPSGGGLGASQFDVIRVWVGIYVSYGKGRKIQKFAK